MKLIKLVLVLIVAGIILLPKDIQAKELEKIGYVNLGRVFFEYTKSKELKATLEDKAKKKDAQRKKMVDDIRRLKDETELLSEKARLENEPKIEKKIKELQEFDQSAKEEITKEGTDSSQTVLSDIEAVINDYAKKEGYSIIFDSEALLFGDDAFNLTDIFIKQLNDSYSKNHPSKVDKK